MRTYQSCHLTLYPVNLFIIHKTKPHSCLKSKKVRYNDSINVVSCSAFSHLEQESVDEVQVTGNQKTIAGRKTIGLVTMYHGCVVSGRRLRTSMVYISVQPDRYTGVSYKNAS